MAEIVLICRVLELNCRLQHSTSASVDSTVQYSGVEYCRVMQCSQARRVSGGVPVLRGSLRRTKLGPTDHFATISAYHTVFYELVAQEFLFPDYCKQQNLFSPLSIYLFLFSK